MNQKKLPRTDLINDTGLRDVDSGASILLNFGLHCSGLSNDELEENRVDIEFGDKLIVHLFNGAVDFILINILFSFCLRKSKDTQLQQFGLAVKTNPSCTNMHYKHCGNDDMYETIAEERRTALLRQSLSSLACGVGSVSTEINFVKSISATINLSNLDV
jgi:hypothetical protein